MKALPRVVQPARRAHVEWMRVELGRVGVRHGLVTAPFPYIVIALCPLPSLGFAAARLYL